MNQIVVTYDRMDADSSGKPYHSRETQYLPETSGRRATPNAEEYGDSRRTNRSAKPRSVMGDQRYQTVTNALEIRPLKTHEGQILRHKDSRHAEGHHGKSAGNHTGRSCQQKRAPYSELR